MIACWLRTTIWVTVASSRVLQAPFGLIAVASHAQILAALRTFEASEIVLYSWRWRLRVPAGVGSLPEKENLRCVMQ